MAKKQKSKKSGNPVLKRILYIIAIIIAAGAFGVLGNYVAVSNDYFSEFFETKKEDTENDRSRKTRSKRASIDIPDGAERFDFEDEDVSDSDMPKVYANQGGSVSPTKNGGLEIMPDEGNYIQQILVNDQWAPIKTDTSLTGFTSTDTVVVIFDPNPQAEKKKSDKLPKLPKGVNCTKAHLIHLLWAHKGAPTPTTDDNPFSDVLETDYYYEAVLWAVETDLIEAKDGSKFNPQKVCTYTDIFNIIDSFYCL